MADLRTVYLNNVRLEESKKYGCDASQFLAYLRYRLKLLPEIEIGPADVPWLSEKSLRNIRNRLNNVMFKAVKRGQMFVYSDVVEPRLIGGEVLLKGRVLLKGGLLLKGGEVLLKGGVPRLIGGEVLLKGGVHLKEEEVKEGTNSDVAPLLCDDFENDLELDTGNVLPPVTKTGPQAPTPKPPPSNEYDPTDPVAMRRLSKQRQSGSGARAKKADKLELEAMVEELVKYYPSSNNKHVAAVKSLQDTLATYSWSVIKQAALVHGASREPQYLPGLHRFLDERMFLNQAPVAIKRSGDPAEIVVETTKNMRNES